MTKRFFIGIALVSICIHTIAQTELFRKKEFIYNGDTLRYRILEPDASLRNKKFPLVVFLHGSGECGSNNESQLAHGANLFANPTNRTNYPAFVIFPQCPKSDSWVRIKDLADDKFELIDSLKPTKALFLVQKLTEFYQRNDSIDSNRIYVGGLSLGGMGTLDLICRYPKTYAAAVSICGAVNTDRLKVAIDIPLRLYTGTDDDVVDPQHSRAAAYKLKAFRAKNIEIVEFPGVKHNSWDTAFAQPDFMSWLFSQSNK